MPYEPPATDQINHDHEVTRRTVRGRYSLARGRRDPRLVRQKGARRPPAKTEKTMSPPPRPKPRAAENPMPGVADLARPAHAGGYRRPGLQNLLLNLYSLVKEHSTPTRRSSRKRPDRFEAGQALIVNSRKAVREHHCSRSPFRARGRADKYVRVRTRTDSK